MILSSSRFSALLSGVFAIGSALAQCVPAWVGGGLPGNYFVHSLAVSPGGDLIAGGWTGGVTSGDNVRRWDGSSWSPLGNSIDGAVWAACAPADDRVYVGGGFTSISGVSASRIALWNGSTWSPVGGGFAGGEPGTSPSLTAMVSLPNGQLVAGGHFTVAGGAAANHVARWDGTAWSPLGSGLGNGPPATNAMAFVVHQGDLIVGGRFGTAGGIAANGIARWTGATWLQLGSGMNETVAALAVLPSGELVAGGSFTIAGGVPAPGIAKWNGSSWSSLGGGMTLAFGSPGSVSSLAVLPNGDLLAAGFFSFAGGVPARRIARWNGSTWLPLAGGVNNGTLQAVATLPTGGVVAGGSFASSASQAGPNLARYIPCPASAVPHGSGCSGSGGVKVLTPTALPWVGATFRATATGLPQPAFVFVVTGFATTSVVLSTILPVGLTGCDLLVAPDVVDVVVSTGTVDTQVAVPNHASLIGSVFHQQVVPMEVDGALSAVALTSTNALSMTIGSY